MSEIERTVLIVEDEASVRLGLEFQLENEGRILTARAVEEALATVEQMAQEQVTPTVAIVDLQLPVDSTVGPDAGFTFIEEAYQRLPRLRFIILTIRNDKDAWERAKKCQADGLPVHYFFTKPWRSNELVAAVRECLDNEAGSLQLIGEVEGIDEDQQT